MQTFIREFTNKENAAKSLLGAITMSLLLVYENRENPFQMYQIALCGQFIYSFLLGNFWMSSYQTLKKKMPKSFAWRGILSTFMVSSVAGLATLVIQILLMNPEALPTAWWAFRLMSR